MAHHVDHTERSKFVTWHSGDVKSNLFLVKRALFDEDALLLLNRRVHDLSPLEDVAMTGSQLVCFALFNKTKHRVLVSRVGRFKG